jgi:hypothetical protein
MSPVSPDCIWPLTCAPVGCLRSVMELSFSVRFRRPAALCPQSEASGRYDHPDSNDSGDVDRHQLAWRSLVHCCSPCWFGKVMELDVV